MVPQKIKNIRFVFKYLFSGGFAFVLDFLAFYLGLNLLVMSVVNANMLGVLVGFLSGFLLYQYWVFPGNKFVLKSFLYMTALLFVNLMLTNQLIHFGVHKARMDAEWLKIGLQICVVIWNFFIYKYLIFGLSHDE